MAAFHDTRYEDFLASAAAIGPAMARAVEQSLGATIRDAVEATRHWTHANTNLGIVLLLAPLARAALDPAPDPLPRRLDRVLDAASVADTADVYAAIRRAAPAGLGRVADQDIAAPPSVPLRAAMALAADRDAIAREYATGFATTFEAGAPALARARHDGLSWPDATVETYLTLLAAMPDTHVARKLGATAAEAVSREAGTVIAAGGVRTEAGRTALAAFDAALRDPRNSRNPGATADLTAAAIFAALLDGLWG